MSYIFQNEVELLEMECSGEVEWVDEYEESISTISDDPGKEIGSTIPPAHTMCHLPQTIPSNEEVVAKRREILSSTSEDEGFVKPKPRKPQKKFFENTKFYTKKNNPIIPNDQWDEEENLDNIETLMKQTFEHNELDAAAMDGVIPKLIPNYGYDDMLYKEFPKPTSSAESNYDLILSSSDEEKVPKMPNDHYKELVLADDRIIDCQADAKMCGMKTYPKNYYGLGKILERKEKVKNQKQATNNLGSYMNIISNSYEGSFCPSGSVKRKGWKLKEPFPKKDSLEHDLSSTSTMDVGAENDRKLDESRPGPLKVFPKCKWHEECVFKLLLKLAIKREKKLSTIKTDLDFDVDEILDDLFSMSKDARGYLINKITDDFLNYKAEFLKTFDIDRKQSDDSDVEEIELWADLEKKVNDNTLKNTQVISDSNLKDKRKYNEPSSRLYKCVPRNVTPRFKIETQLALKRSLDVKKKKNVIKKQFKPIEINYEALPQAMDEYYKSKEDQKRRKERELKPKDDDETKKMKTTKLEKPKSETSLYPSYTKLIPPYSNVCKERIRKTLKAYRKMFNQELQSLADQETFALAGVALRRMYLITMGKGENPVKYTAREQARLYRLLEH